MHGLALQTGEGMLLTSRLSTKSPVFLGVGARVGGVGTISRGH